MILVCYSTLLYKNTSFAAQLTPSHVFNIDIPVRILSLLLYDFCLLLCVKKYNNLGNCTFSFEVKPKWIVSILVTCSVPFSLCRPWTTKAKRKDGSIYSKISLERPNYYLQNSKYLQKSSAQWKGSFNIFFFFFSFYLCLSLLLYYGR